jgi:hypothetical protein
LVHQQGFQKNCYLPFYIYNHTIFKIMYDGMIQTNIV